MAGVAVLIAVICAVFVAWAGSRVLVRASAKRALLLDDTVGDLRKVHVDPVPRIGGAAVAVGLLGGAAVCSGIGGFVEQWLLLLVCVSPGFAWGLIEDLSKRGAVTARLAITGTSAALAFFLLDARISSLDVHVLDRLLSMPVVSFLFTVFAVTGVAHAMNVIDGLNGLSGFIGLCASIGLAVVAWTVGSPWIFAVACVLAASLAGFLVVNFPSGRIFLGDGGAYLVGLVLAELAVLLVQRNSEVSPWFPLVLLAYPVWETLFSMYRRYAKGHSTGRADALHLHTIVYRRVVRWHGFRAAPHDFVVRNSLASLVLWPIPLLCLAAGLLFWEQSLFLKIAALVFALAYVLAYRMLVRLAVPSWMVIRAAPRAIEAEGAAEDPAGARAP